INAGLTNSLATNLLKDLAGNNRVIGTNVDLGAYESTATTTTPPTSTLRDPENPTGALAPGLNYNYYEGTWNAIPDFTPLTPVKSDNTATFDITPANRADYFAFHFYGYVTIPADGQYTFFTNSDDGSKLYIGNTLVVDNDGPHDIQEKSGTIGLKAGRHFIAVDYFEAFGGNTLQVSYQSANLSKRLIPASALVRATATPPTTTLRPAENPTGALAAGLNYNYYQGTWNKLPDFTPLTPTKTGTTTTFDITPAAQADNFAFHFYGYVTVPADGVYTFFTNSDDGSKLFIGNTLVVDNDGPHEVTEKSGTIGLKAGKHFIAVDYFEASGNNTLQVSFQGPGVAKKLIPTSALVRRDYSVATTRPAAAASKAAGESVVAYPNPTAGRTTFRYQLKQTGAVRLEVLNSQGRLVTVLVNGKQTAGAHEAVFEAPAGQGITFYNVRLTTPAGTSSSRLTVDN
ncbi:PA14 domain-containing protein, partial [Hymenobacter terrenus]|uniref:PA14 domain-containing protein n=1 Tax=Hymenobacter terrenus TaxID=1629124 RepID=UPI000619667A